MKEQWKEFLEENDWPFEIVPYLISCLIEAIDNNDSIAVREVLNDLYYQGIAIDSDGNLCFVVDYVLCLDV